MRKTDKKIDNKLRQLLTEVCEYALQNCAGYQWITHSVNYTHFPESLIITCMFSDELSATEAKQQDDLLTLIQQKLNTVPINVKNIHKQIRFESQAVK